MANGGRKFLIEFMVEADQAVKASDELSNSLKGVSGQVGTAAESITETQATVAKASSTIGDSAASVNDGVAGVAGNVNILSQSMTSILNQSGALEQASGGASHGVGDLGEGFSHASKKGLLFFKTLLGVEHIFSAIEKRSPLRALMGLAILFVKLDHLVGGHKKKWHALTDAQQLAIDKSRAMGTVSGMAAKALKDQAAQLLASSAMATDSAKAEDLRNQAMMATTKAQELEKQALGGVVGSRLANAAALGQTAAGHKKLNIVAKLGNRLDKMGFKTLGQSIKSSKIARAGSLKDFLLGKKSNKLAKSQLKTTGALSGGMAGLAENAGAASKGVAGAEGAAAGGGGLAALVVALPLVLAALPAIAFAAMALAKALRPLGRIFGLMFDVFERFIEIIALPLQKPLEALEEIVEDVFDVFDDLATALEPVLEEFGEIMSGPIADVGKMFVDMLKDVLGASDGFSAFTVPLKELAEQIKPLAAEMKPLLENVFIAMKPVLQDLTKNMAQFFTILMEVFVEMVKVLPTFLEMLPEMLQMIAELGKIVLMIFKALLPMIGPLAKYLVLWLGGAFKAVSFIIQGVGKAITWLGELGEKLGIWFEGFWNDLKTGAESLFSPFKALGEMLSGIGDIAQKVKTYFFGSGLWGIPEAMVPVMADLKSFNGLLTDIGKNAEGVKGSIGGLGEIGQPGVNSPVRVLSEAPGSSPSTPLHTSVVDSPASSADPAVTAQRRADVGSSRATPVQITVPITVELDGMTLAKVVGEYLGSIRRDRFMDEPMGPLRGVEA